MRNRILELHQEMAFRPRPRGQTLAIPTHYRSKWAKMYQQGEAVPATDEVYLFNALQFFYPESSLQQHEMNDALRALSAVMIHDAITASRQMDRVPRPTGRPTVTWALKQAVRALFTDSRSRGVYESVRVTVARNRRSEFELARMGESLTRHTTRSFNAVSYQVPGIIPALRQPNGMACWATVTTMMYSWKENASFSIEDTLGRIGPTYLQLFQTSQGLAGSMKEQFLRDAGLQYKAPQNPTIGGWEQMLRSYGPLWVTTDEDPSEAFAIHARVLIGMQGDGSPDGTQMRFVDPATGRVVNESFSQFLVKYESEALDKNQPLRIQIVHWPQGVSNISHGSSWGSTKLSRARQDGVIHMEPEVITISPQRREQLLRSAGWKQANLSVIVKNFLGEPMLGHQIFAEAQAAGVEPQTYAQEVRGGSAIFSNIWLKPSGTLRILAVSIGTPSRMPSGVVHYTLPANNHLRLDATQASRDIEVTATSSREAATKAGVTGSAGVEFQIFSAGVEVTSEETNTQGSSVSRRYVVRVPTSTLNITVL